MKYIDLHSSYFVSFLGAEANKIMDKVDEDRITAEIEDLQHKLGDLQANIDRVLRQVIKKGKWYQSLKFSNPLLNVGDIEEKKEEVHWHVRKTKG